MISIYKWLQGALALAIVALGILEPSVCYAQVDRQTSSAENELRWALQHHLQDRRIPDFEPTLYVHAFVDLAGNGKREAIVYVSGRGWCGSSGCHMLVLTEKGSSYRVVAEIPGVKLPIRVLGSKSHGWRDLSVFIQGGGVLDGYEEKVKFNGSTYTEEPSETTDKRPRQQMKGTTILSGNDKEVQLYP
jgi:hypothetical protein